MTKKDVVKHYVLKNPSGVCVAIEEDIRYTYLSMGTVKIDSCEPDWDVHAVQVGGPYLLYSNVSNPEEWGA